MNRNIAILIAALSYDAPLMDKFRETWYEESDQTEASALQLIAEIKTRFLNSKHPLTSTDHAGLAALLGVPVVSYKTPTVSPIETGSFTAVSLRNYGEVSLPYFVDGVDADED